MLMMFAPIGAIILLKSLFLVTEANPGGIGTGCPASMRACSNGMCLPEKWFCDGDKDCPSGEDETSCGWPAPWQPQPQTQAPWQPQPQPHNPWQQQPQQTHWQFPVPQPQPQPQPHPPFPQPELNPWSNPVCSPDSFLCGSSCIPSQLRCNGIIDCPDGTDERNCPLQPAPGSDAGCAVDEVRCYTGKCIKTNKICDGLVDCDHYEDEFACSFIKNKEFTYRCVEKCIGIPKTNCTVTSLAPVTLPPTTTRPLIRFCDFGFTLIFDRCIKVTVFPPLPWEAAKQASQADNAVLVEIDNGDFFLELQAYLNQSQYESYSYWTGANDVQSEGNWIWSSTQKQVHLGAPLWTIAREGNTYLQQPAGGREQNCGLLEDCPFQYMNDEDCNRKYPYISQRQARVKSW